MSSSTSIEWTDATWNPVVGCSRKSPGCIHCYAEMMAARVANAAMAKLRDGKAITTTERAYVDAVRWKDGVAQRAWSGQLVLDTSKLNEPLRWAKPRRVFVNSMSDLWHERLEDRDVLAVYRVMASCRRHVYQVLTKRPERRRRVFSRGASWLDPDELGHVWEGTSIESADYLGRLEYLRQTPAAVRFLSLEPLLGPLPDLDLTGIHWVIVGGESGPGARPMHPDWACSIRDQCQAQSVPFFFKQWGAWQNGSSFSAAELVVLADGATYSREDVAQGKIHERHRGPCGGWAPGLNPVVMANVGKKNAGGSLHGVKWHEFPKENR